MGDGDVANGHGTAVVLGVETQIGLAMVRELGRAGVRVVALSHDRFAIGLASRFLWRHEVVGPPRSAAVIDLVNRLARELGPLSLLTVSEGNLKWLDSVRDQFDSNVALAVPSRATLAAVLDKAVTLDAARKIGIDVPLTVQPESLADAEAMAHTLTYPVVLKWADANDIAARLTSAGLPLVKAEFAYDAAELLSIATRYDAVGCWPMIQSYCPGQGLGQFFFMYRGEAVRRFQHWRVAEWPPEGGYSSVCDAVPEQAHASLQKNSIALLKALGWEGVAMVEYRHDPKTGRSVLMEVNGRFWGSLPLAVAADAGFVQLTHAAALGLPLPTLGPVQTGLRCRMVVTELKRLRRLLLQPHLIVDRGFKRRPVAEIVRFVTDFLRPSVRYFVWSSDDPMPALRDLRNALTRRG